MRGVRGGEDGAPGRNFVRRLDGSLQEMPGKFRAELPAGESVVIETPGGGGWGGP